MSRLGASLGRSTRFDKEPPATPARSHGLLGASPLRVGSFGSLPPPSGTWLQRSIPTTNGHPWHPHTTNIAFLRYSGLACLRFCDMKDTVFELAILGSGSAGNSALI